MKRSAPPAGLPRFSLPLAGLLVIIALAPVRPLLHFQSTTHVYCATHQQIEHVPRTRTRVAIQSDRVLSGSIGTDLYAHGHHEACGCCPGLVEPFLAEPDGRAIDSPSGLLVKARAAGGDRAFESISLLTLAPKTSPPVS
jgi:hypothetical protein